MNQFVILSFGVDPLNWPSFIEIGEIACSTPAWCIHGLTCWPFALRQLVGVIFCLISSFQLNLADDYYFQEKLDMFTYK